VLELCKLIKLSAPEESNFEGSILENWELLGDGVISGNGDGVLGLRSEVHGKIGLRKAEGHGEGQEKRKELEFKMSYGDKRLKERERCRRVEESAIEECNRRVQ
jgi:hypothetical protein